MYSNPPSEAIQMTLPVFDNHRVAKQFSRGLNRVVKIPDGRLISKTSQYLTARGITRILLKVKVFALALSAPLHRSLRDRSKNGSHRANQGKCR